MAIVPAGIMSDPSAVVAHVGRARMPGAIAPSAVYSVVESASVSSPDPSRTVRRDEAASEVSAAEVCAAAALATVALRKRRDGNHQ